MKNSNYIIGNRTRSLPQPTAPPRAPPSYGTVWNYWWLPTSRRTPLSRFQDKCRVEC